MIVRVFTTTNKEKEYLHQKFIYKIKHKHMTTIKKIVFIEILIASK